MDFATLQQAISNRYVPQSKQFTLGVGDLESGPINQLLSQTLKVTTTGLQIFSDTAPTSDGQAVTLSGVSSIYGFTNAPVTASFDLDDEGVAQMRLRLKLPRDWNFIKGFPELSKSVFEEIAIALDPVPLYIFTSYARTEPDLNINLKTGLNFYGEARPTGKALGAATAVLGGFTQSPLYGSIVSRSYGPTIMLTFDYGATLKQYFPDLDMPVQMALVNEYDPDGKGRRAGLQLSVPFNWGGHAITLLCLLTNKEIGVLYFKAAFDGFDIPGPQELAKLIGEADLVGSLPERYQASGQIKLKSIVIGIGVRKLKLTKVAIELAALEGDGWEVVPDWLTLKNVKANFTVQDPLSPTWNARCDLFAELDVPSPPARAAILQMDVGGSALRSDYSFFASIKPGTTFNLTDLLAEFIPEVEDGPNIVFDNLGLRIQKTQAQIQYSFNAALSTDWNFNVGPLTLIAVQHAAVELNSSGNKGGMGGTISGALVLFDAEMDFSYTLPGSFQINAIVPSFDVNLQKIATDLAGSSWKAPSWFPDFTFPRTQFYIARQADGADTVYTFVMRAFPDLGVIAIEVKRQGGQWGFAAGINLIAPKISEIPGLESLSVFDEVFRLNSLMLAVSSINQADFQFADQAAFNASSAGWTGKKVSLPAQAGGIQEGINLFASMTFDTTGHQAMVRNFLSLNATLGVALQLGATPSQNSRLFASIAGTINEVTTLVGNFGGALQNGQLSLFLDGVVHTSIQGQKRTFGLTFIFVPSGAVLTASMLGAPVQFGPVQLANVILEIGINLVGIPSIGFAATLDVRDFDSSIAVFFDSTNPAESLMAGAISDTTLDQVVKTLVGPSNENIPSEVSSALRQVGIKGTGAFLLPGSLSSDLNSRNYANIAAAFANAGYVIPNTEKLLLLIINSPGEVWHLTDLQNNMTHYALKKKGDQIEASLQPQIYLCMNPAGVTIGPIGGSIRYNQGYFLNGEIDLFFIKARAKVVIQQSKGISVDASVDPFVVYKPEYLSVTGYNGEGGPVLSLATYMQPNQTRADFRPPHIFVSGEVRLLGVVGNNLLLSVSKSGLNFNLQGELVIGTQFDLRAEFDSLTNFGGGGTATVGVKRDMDFGALGKINLDTQVAGKIELGYKAQTVTANFAGNFVFQGAQYNIAQFKLDIDKAPLANLAETLADKIKEVFNNFLNQADKWLDWARKGILTGVGDLNQITTTLYRTFKKDGNAAIQLLKNATYAAADIAKAINVAYGWDGNKIAAAFKAVGYSATDVSNALNTAFKWSSNQTAAALRAAGYSATETTAALQSVYKLGANQIASVLKSAGYSASDIATVLNKVFKWSAKDTAKFMKDTLKYGDDTVNKALKSAGYASKEIEKAMKSVFNWAEDNLNPKNWF